MFTIRVIEPWVKLIDDLKLENVAYEKKISENTPMMNDYFRAVIQRNKEQIDKYTERAIEIIIDEEA